MIPSCAEENCKLMAFGYPSKMWMPYTYERYCSEHLRGPNGERVKRPDVWFCNGIDSDECGFPILWEGHDYCSGCSYRLGLESESEASDKSDVADKYALCPGGETGASGATGPNIYEWAKQLISKMWPS